MKKIISIMMCVIMLMGTLTACGTNSNEESNIKDTTALEQTKVETSELAEKNQTPDKKDSKVLVAYYSATGSTESVAKAIAENAGADLFEITPKDEYTSEDLDWTDENSRVCAEHDDPDGRHVELVTTVVENLSDYDTVFIGYPIWWGIAAWPVDDFVKGNDFSGKRVIPFCTSSSSGLGESGGLLAEMAGTGNWQDGMRFSSGANDKEVINWVRELGF